MNEQERWGVVEPMYAGQGWIRLICRPGNSAMASIPYESGVDLDVFVDSLARMSNWGESILPVTAGDHVLSVQLNGYVKQHLGPVRTIRFGAADLPIRVAPGQTITVYYAAPNGPRTPGRFSFTPPPPPPVNRDLMVPNVIMCVLLCVALLALALVIYFGAT